MHFIYERWFHCSVYFVLSVRAASHYTISVVRRIRLDAICHDGSSQVIVANDWHRDPCDAPSHTTRLISNDGINLTIYRDVSHILNMLKMLRRPAIPSDCKNRSRQNRRGSHTTQCPVADSVVGGHRRSS